MLYLQRYKEYGFLPHKHSWRESIPACRAQFLNRSKHQISGMNASYQLFLLNNKIRKLKENVSWIGRKLILLFRKIRIVPGLQSSFTDLQSDWCFSFEDRCLIILVYNPICMTLFILHCYWRFSLKLRPGQAMTIVCYNTVTQPGGKGCISSTMWDEVYQWHMSFLDS